MTKTEKAYLAGLLDGEGTITLTRPRKSQHPQPQVSISNNSLRLVRWVRRKVGCGAILTKRPRKRTHSVSYAWQVNFVGGSIRVLKLVYPYLRLKRPQAEIILKKYLNVTPRNGKYSKKMLERKMALVERMHHLNRRPKLSGL